MHAFEDIAGLYREELRSLREDAARFAVRNPGMARQLGLASDTQPDPLVNLLLESFAWLAARVRADAESRLPLVSHSLLGLLYPQFVCPIPSVGVAEFIPNPAGVAGLPDGFGIPAHTSIHNRDERGGVLRWRTARPLTLHPAKVVRASIIPPASWMPAGGAGRARCPVPADRGDRGAFAGEVRIALVVSVPRRGSVLDFSPARMDAWRV